MHNETSPYVYLIGCGPGSKDYLTLRAADIIAKADVILHDELINSEIIEMAKSGAEIINVGRRHCSKKDPETRMQIITETINSNIRKGKTIARLKSGDPLIFGRAAEEMKFLETEGIPYSIIPGISAGLAAAAEFKIPLTSRGTCNTLVISTGTLTQGANTEMKNNCNALNNGTCIMIYMATKQIWAIAHQFINNGAKPSSRVTIGSKVGTSEQKAHIYTLMQLTEISLDELENIELPAIAIIHPEGNIL